MISNNAICLLQYSFLVYLLWPKLNKNISVIKKCVYTINQKCACWSQFNMNIRILSRIWKWLGHRRLRIGQQLYGCFANWTATKRWCFPFEHDLGCQRPKQMSSRFFLFCWVGGRFQGWKDPFWTCQVAVAFACVPGVHLRAMAPRLHPIVPTVVPSRHPYSHECLSLPNLAYHLH